MIPKASVIVVPLSRVQPFLAHEGARLGLLDDPPGPSFCVEGGVFRDLPFPGVVITPVVPSAGATRVDMIIANPGTGDIEVVEGIEGAGAPTLAALPNAGKIAQLTLVGNANSKVLVRNADLLDLRAFDLSTFSSENVYRVLATARFALGAGSLPTIGDTFAAGKLSVVAVRSWISVNKLPHHYNRTMGTQVSYVDLKYLGSVDDFHITVSPYNSLLACVTEGQDNWNSSNGLTWVMLPSDADGYPKFRVLVGIVNAHGNTTDQERITAYSTSGTFAGKFIAYDTAQVQIQAWGR
jgi:hypothetical protein